MYIKTLNIWLEQQIEISDEKTDLQLEVVVEIREA